MAKIQDYINKVKDPDTRRAVQKVLELIRTDMATNKAIFDAHTHVFYATDATSHSSGPGSDTAGVAGETDTTMTVTLTG